MSTYLVTQTSLAQIRPVDPGVDLSGRALAALLRTEMGAEAREIIPLFADPAPVEDAASVDWYTDLPGQPKPLGELPEEERAQVLARIGEQRARLGALAETIEARGDGASLQSARTLRAALSVPSNDDHIYLIDGTPVIVGWGYQLSAPGAAPVPMGVWLPSRTPEGADGAGSDGTDQITDTTLVSAAPAVPVRGGANWFVWLLWLLFLLLMLAILYLVLTACSAGWPGTNLQARIGLWDRCPAPREVVVVNDAEREVAREADLQRQIAEAERALAEEAQTCRVQRVFEAENRPPPLPPEPVPEPEPTPPPEENSDVEDALDRVEDAGGQEGAFQIILQWDGPADLDLHIQCGGDVINYRPENRNGCGGGELDVDANNNQPMPTPVENVRWADDPPPGTYRVEVDNFSNKTDPRDEIPYTVIVRRNGEATSYPGVVRRGGRNPVTEIRIP